MSQLSDPEYLSKQYRTASNLNARIELHRRFSTNPYGWHRWIFDQFHLAADCRILELGCGPADLWLENLERIPPGWQITLSDFSPGMVQEAQKQLSNSKHPFSFKVIDAQKIPLPDAHLDAVIANHMLYHVPDRPQALREIHRVLKPGACLYASTVGKNHMKESLELAATMLSSGVNAGRTGGDAKNELPPVPFTLENGAEQLAPWFGPITLHRYPDELVVTESEPFMAYILSGIAQRAAVPADKLDKLRHYVENEIARHSAIHITKDSGLFVATRKETL